MSKKEALDAVLEAADDLVEKCTSEDFDLEDVCTAAVELKIALKKYRKER